MANWYLSSVKYAAVVAWAASTAYSVGDLRRQLATPAFGNERVFRCTTAGTSGGSEPAWSLTKNSTTADGTAVWTEVTGNAIYGWNAPHASVAGLAGYPAGGDLILAADDHNESSTGAYTATVAGATGGAPVSFVSVDRNAAIPGINDVKPGATIKVPAAVIVNITTVNNGGSLYFYGFKFVAGNGSGVSYILFASDIKLERCYIDTSLNTYSSGGVRFTGGFAWLENTQVKLGTGNGLTGSGPYGGLLWRNTVSPLDVTGYHHNSNVGIMTGSLLMFENCDFRPMANVNISMTASLTASQVRVIYKNCRFPAISNYWPSSTALGGAPFQIEHIVIRSDQDGGSLGYRRVERQLSTGAQTVDVSVYKIDGGTDGLSPQSMKYLTNLASQATPSWQTPFHGMQLEVMNSVALYEVTATVEGLASPVAFSALPLNDEVWIEVVYMASSSSPLGGVASGTKANILATGAAQQASTAKWTAPARANSKVYAQGDAVEVASNPGRVFFCTTAGTSNGSEPAGYASAVDGGTVTDGTATFKAGWRFKMSVKCVSPPVMQAGPITVYPKMAKASAVVYLDPIISLS